MAKYSHNYISFLCSEISKSLIHSDNKPIQILDVGCGNGDLIKCIKKYLDKSGINTEIYGIEIIEHAGRRDNYVAILEKNLESLYSANELNKYIKLISQTEVIPFKDGSMDIVVCCQVMEHVKDLDSFINNYTNVLNKNGSFISLFPLYHIIIEPHIKIPLVHKKLNSKFISFIYTTTMFFGLGKLGNEKSKLLCRNNKVLENKMIKYLEDFTNYKNYNYIKYLFQQNKMKLNKEYSALFVIGRVVGLVNAYKIHRSIYFILKYTRYILMYITSITFVATKSSNYE